MEGELKKDSFNSLWMMLDSGARANMTQVRQMAGMRGLMNDSNDDPIPRPIKSNLREGLSVLEYFHHNHWCAQGLGRCCQAYATFWLLHSSFGRCGTRSCHQLGKSFGVTSSTFIYNH